MLSIKLLPFLKISPLLWILLLLLFHGTVLLPKAKIAEEILQAEAKEILPPPDTQLQKSTSMIKTNGAGNNLSFSTQLSAKDIFKFYDQSLGNMGWRFYRQADVTQEPINRIYCKGNLTAEIEYYLKDNPWRYNLWLFVGEPSDCQMIKGGLFFIPFTDLWFVLAFLTSWLIYAVIILRFRRVNKKDQNGLVEERIRKEPSSLILFGIIVFCAVGSVLCAAKILLFIINQGATLI